MFDFSFGELAVCLLVALVVLGPEKLHGLIQGLGRFVGRARVYLRTLSMELDRETELGELRRQVEETKQMFREQAEGVGNAVKSVQQDINRTGSSEGPNPPCEEPLPTESRGPSEPVGTADPHGAAGESRGTVQRESPSERIKGPEESISETKGQNHRGQE